MLIKHFPIFSLKEYVTIYKKPASQVDKTRVSCAKGLNDRLIDLEDIFVDKIVVYEWPPETKLISTVVEVKSWLLTDVPVDSIVRDWSTLDFICQLYHHNIYLL